MSKKYETRKSRKLFDEAKKYLVNGLASALHKSPFEEYPIYVDHGLGSKIYDVDGNEYIDYLCGYGPMILGYCPRSVSEAVKEQIDRGSQFASPYKMLNEVSQKLVNTIPCAELVAYQSSGTEANMLLFRLVRAYTGKEKIIKFEGHYHGWSDEQMISFNADSLQLMGPRVKPWKTLGSAGQRIRAGEDIIVLPWNDIDIAKTAIKRHRNEIAAVVLEPIMCNCEPVFPKPGYLKGLRELTAKNEILLVFDEIITGFRLSLGGAQEYFQVMPDVSTFGKAVAAGYPLAGVAGRREILESDVHPVGTFNANPIVIAACKATLEELQRPGVYSRMATLTKKIVDGINIIARKEKITLYCTSEGSIWQIAFGISERLNDYRDSFRVDKMSYQHFRKKNLERGIRLHPSRGRQYLSTAHTDEDVDSTLVVFEEALHEIARKIN